MRIWLTEKERSIFLLIRENKAIRALIIEQLKDDASLTDEPEKNFQSNKIAVGSALDKVLGEVI
jgi:hypothetical protein